MSLAITALAISCFVCGFALRSLIDEWLRRRATRRVETLIDTLAEESWRL